MKTIEEKAKYDMEYQKSHMTRVTVWFNKEKDADILEWLDHSGKSKSERIKDTIRNQMNHADTEENL